MHTNALGTDLPFWRALISVLHDTFGIGFVFQNPFLDITPPPIPLKPLNTHVFT